MFTVLEPVAADSTNHVGSLLNIHLKDAHKVILTVLTAVIKVTTNAVSQNIVAET